MAKRITVYTLQELKATHPKGFAKALEEWQSRVAKYYEPSSDIMKSLKATLKHFQAHLVNWKIGAWSVSFIGVRLPEDDEGKEIPQTLEAVEESLTKLGYTLPKRGEIYEPARAFPGLCKLTGVCYDEDDLQHVYERVAHHGDTLHAAIESLASVVRRQMEEDIESQQSEESFLENRDDSWFLPNGDEVSV